MQRMTAILEEGKYVLLSSAPQPVDMASSFSSDEDEEYQIISKTQMYDFNYPLAGMYLWMRAHYETHPLFAKVEHERLARALWIHMTQEPYLVLVSPGSIFSPTEALREEKGWKYFRLCFVAVDDDVIEKYSKAVVDAFRSFWTKKKVSDIDEILKDEEMALLGAMQLSACPVSH
jgi:aspartate/methionine/tyrosine aminotransferase